MKEVPPPICPSVRRPLPPGQHPCAHVRKRTGVRVRQGARVGRHPQGGLQAKRAQARGLAGVQWCGWCEGANPGRQIQRKEPSVLTQRALMQSGVAASASSHSLMSGVGRWWYKERCYSGLETWEPASLSFEASGAEGLRVRSLLFGAECAYYCRWLCEPGLVAYPPCALV